MSIRCLRNLNLVAIICEIEGDEMVARWVQIHPNKIATILGTDQELVEPKTENSALLTVRVPTKLSPVHTDVRFKIIRADSAVGGEPRTDAAN